MGAYHQLGIIAEERRDFSVAEQWYLKSLAISEKKSNEGDAAIVSSLMSEDRTMPVAMTLYSLRPIMKVWLPFTR